MFERAATGDGRAITLLLVVGGMLTAPGRMGSPYLPRSAPIAQGIEQRFPKLWIATLSDPWETALTWVDASPAVVIDDRQLPSFVVAYGTDMARSITAADWL